MLIKLSMTHLNLIATFIKHLREGLLHEIVHHCLVLNHLLLLLPL